MQKVLSGRADSNIPFANLLSLLKSLGFDHRQSGSHHILTKSGIRDRINLQEDGTHAKAYQVRQVRKTLITNQLISNE